MGLRGVFDDNQSMPPRYFHNRIHVGRLTIEVNGQDRLGAWRNCRFNRSGIHRERARINIYQHRSRSGVDDCGDASYKCEWYRDDFVARTDSGREQREMQSACSGVQGNALRSAAVGCKFLFESRHFRAEHKLATVQHARNRGINLRLDALILCFQVEIRNLNVCHKRPEPGSLFSHPPRLGGSLKSGQAQIHRAAMLRHRLRSGLQNLHHP